MHNSKLIRILRQFNRLQRKHLVQFSQSEYHNSNSKLATLIPYLVKQIDAGKDDYDNSFYREYVWGIINSEEPYNYEYLRKIFSDAIRLIEDFIAFERLKNDIYAKTHFLIEGAVLSENQEIQNLALNRYEQNKNLFFDKQNSVNIYKTPILKNLLIILSLDKKRYKESGIDDILFELDKYYITEKLKLLCELESRNMDIDFSTFTFFNNIIDEINLNTKFRTPAILVYYYIYKTISEPTIDENYFVLKDIITNSYLEFDPYEAKSIFDATISYGVLRINKGDTKFLKETLLLYKQGLKSGILTYDNKIDSYNFKIIVVIGLRLEEYDWIEYFIETYSSLVSEEERDNTRSYNMAMLHFYKKNYPKVLSLLQQLEYEDLTYNLGAKSMLLATYYEMDEYEPLSSLLDSFKVFLNRKKSKIPSTTITDYQNLIKFTRKLLSLNSNDHIAINKLESEINKAEGVASKKWLLEKIEQLR